MAEKATTPKTVEQGGFKFETGLPVPPLARGSRSSKTADMLAAMPVGASFLEPVTIPDSIKDETERERAFKESARSVSNRLSGAIRRFKKNNDGYEFAMRTVNDPVNGVGVRVWREALPK